MYFKRMAKDNQRMDNPKVSKEKFDAALRKLLAAPATPLEEIKKRPKKARRKAQVRKPQPDQR
jgi:hypothetical protein